MQKGFSLPLVLAGIAVLILGGLIYRNTMTGKPTIDEKGIFPPSSNPTNETADWKTYTNTTYGYSFKYPDVRVSLGKPSPFVKDSDIDKVSKLTLSLPNSLRTGYVKPSMVIQVLDFQKGENEASVLKTDCKSYVGNVKFNSLEEFAQIVYKNGTNKNCSYFKSLLSDLKKDKSFGESETYKFMVRSQNLGSVDGGSLVPEGDITYILSKIGNKYFFVSFDSTEQVFNQILSTFKFTN